LRGGGERAGEGAEDRGDAAKCSPCHAGDCMSEEVGGNVPEYLIARRLAGR
jgi:hypothetical protein